MQGIVEGRNHQKQKSNLSVSSRSKAGEHKKPLNESLVKTNEAARPRSPLYWEREGLVEFEQFTARLLSDCFFDFDRHVR